MKTQVQQNNCLYVINYEENKRDIPAKANATTDFDDTAEREQDALSAAKLLSSNILGITHEIRNPLNNILLATAFLNSEVANPELSIYIDIIERSTKRID